MSDENDHRLAILIADTGVWVECEGREYSPEDESYRPVYGYGIKSPDWEYVGNDIRGGANEIADTHKGMQSLLAFLYACQEGFLKDPNNQNENAKLFPPHVREWAYMHNDEIALAAVEKHVANALVNAAVSVVGDTFDEAEDEGLHHCPDCGDTCSITDYSDGRCRECTADN